MNKQEFAKELANKVADKLGDGYAVTVRNVPRGTCMEPRIIVRRENENVCPNFQIEDFWQRRSMGMDYLAEQFFNLYENVKDSGKNIEPHVKDIGNYETAKDKLRLRLHNRRKNAMYLKDVPYKRFLDDFAMVPYLLIYEEGEASGVTVVSDHILNMWEKDFEEVFEVAKNNTVLFEEMKLGELASFLPEENSTPEIISMLELQKLYVMTNKAKAFGAIQLLLHAEVVNKLAEQTGGLYVIFSSVHETILIADTYSEQKLEELSEMNREVNATTVDEAEILGEKAYYYQLPDGFAD